MTVLSPQAAGNSLSREILKRPILEIALERLLHDRDEALEREVFVIQRRRVALDPRSVRKTPAGMSQPYLRFECASNDRHVLAEDRMIVVTCPFSNLALEIRLTAVALEIREVEKEMLELSRVELVAAQPSEKSGEPAPADLFTEK